MAVTRDQMYSLTLGVWVLALAAITLLQLPPGGEGGGGLPEGPTGVEDTIEDIESGEAEAEAEAIAAEAGLVPMASPCLMRRPHLAEGVDRDWRQGFAAATIATDPEVRAALLAQLAALANSDVARWRVDLAQVEMAIRVGDADGALAHLQAAAGREVPASCRADEVFYAAVLSADLVESSALLDRAVEIDPGFWAALERLALTAARGTDTSAAACEADAIRTMETVVKLGALARRDTQFQRLNRALEAMPSNGRTALLRGMILRQTGEAEVARATYRAGLDGLGTAPCDAILRQGLTGMLAATEGEE